ncbi:MAG: M23 family metallopeptidase [Myxococcales bacterium]|jgi:murein DD-endopeptidase MepM/ murein hydrolase activator NlpD
MRRPRAPSILALAGALLALLAGCATPKPEAPRTPYKPYQLAPQYPVHAQRAEPTLRAPETIEGPPVEQVRIDASLIRFSLEQRSARARVPKGSEMSEETRSRWTGFLAEIDRFLRQPASRTVPLDVIRARVALDAELDLDREHYGLFPSSLTAAVRARAMGLDLRLSQVRKLAQPARPKPTMLSWPIDPVVITSLFGMRTDPFEGDDRFHRGVDLRAKVGQLIQAAAPGVVAFAGRLGGHGLHVEILHDGGLVTRYSHLSLLLVEAGMQVPAAGPVGLAGNTGRSTGPHLHFEVIKDGEHIDPLTVLSEPAFRRYETDNIGDGD